MPIAPRSWCKSWGSSGSGAPSSPPPLLRSQTWDLWCKCEEGRVRNAGKHSTSEDVTSSSSTGKWSENPLCLGLQRAFCDELLAKHRRSGNKCPGKATVEGQGGYSNWLQQGKGKAYKQIDDEKEISKKIYQPRYSQACGVSQFIFWYSFCRS